MAPATLRRHIAALVAASLVLRRDSPNGKRFRRRDADGEGAEEAFGFDLSPLAFRAGAIFEAAEDERREAKIAARLRSSISLHRRDIRKLSETALVEGRAGDWPEHLHRLGALALPRHARATLQLLAATEAALVRLRAVVETAYLQALSEEEMVFQEMSANDARPERHHQNSKTDPSIESKDQEKWRKPEGEEREDGATSAPLGGEMSAGRGVDIPQISAETPPRRAPETRGLSFDLATIFRLCPEITSYALQPMRDWRSFVEVAHLVRGFLGISQDAWTRACEAMGEIQAAAVIAAMLQRSDRIASPGGYLRSLTQKAAKGQFRVEPMLRALE
jgi:replication initiation protein RepC